MATIVRLRSGTEGPRHDPYGWHEIDVEREGKFATLHSSGLFNDWLEIGGIDWSKPDGEREWHLRFEGKELTKYLHQREESDSWGHVDGWVMLRRIFERHIGYSPEELEEAQHRADARNPYFECSLGDYE